MSSANLRAALRALLVIVVILCLGGGSALAQGNSNGNKGKPPKEPVPAFEVRYATDPSSFDIVPDGEGLFGSGGCLPPDCPYVHGENGFTIDNDGGGWRQVHSFDRDLPDIYGDGRVYYRFFETDIESQAIEGNLCPDLIDVSSGWTLGGSYTPGGQDPADRIVRFSIWIDDWPEAGEVFIEATGRALVKGLNPVEEGITDDWDDDGEPEVMLDEANPGWDLVWNGLEHAGSNDLQITRLGNGTFLVESITQAMLRITRPGGKGQRRDCGLVDARFEFVAIQIP